MLNGGKAMNTRQYKAINAYIRRIQNLKRIQYAKEFALFLGGTGKSPNSEEFGLSGAEARDVRVRMLGIMGDNPDINKFYVSRIWDGAYLANFNSYNRYTRCKFEAMCFRSRGEAQRACAGADLVIEAAD
jgi:hypothetical protein